MRYFLTGGTGFLGVHTIRALIDAGHQVTTFDIAPDRQFLQQVLGNDSANVTVISGDVTDGFAVQRAMRGAKAERVVHFAATLSLQSDHNPIKALRVNCEGTLNVFEAALACSVEKVVWASSIGVFGTIGESTSGTGAPGEAYIVENDAPHRPFGVYGACKSFNERLAAHYSRKFALNTIGLRFAHSYGYGKGLTVQRGTRVGFMTDLIDQPALGQPSQVPHGDAVMDWLYASDAARAVILASETAETTAVAVNVCGERWSIAEVASFVSDIVPDSVIEVSPGIWGDNLHYDSTAAREQIGYEPQVDIRTGLRLNINMIRQAHGMATL